ncbi:hydroxymethylbilane synthase [Candidatus Purcelliella pentastirinorum]|uniref:Porphobilinogen deaminase n=1 Tax=Candidatus Purcelliella pentastirinorum TaxID=472834 RepID=A0AAX3N791_9ENTR|nr:hydroxymethylbilane synthase [Candidatus Purcelliella pentastirinorum]WDI78462.1 hydroxymethylbilane synthase [Candidatus Purcelliella pentastirinorum]
MLKKKIKIATRNSPLAIKQAEYVKKKIQHIYPKINVELFPVITKNNKISKKILNDQLNKGIFVKNLEIALLKKDADLAVHSVKDLSTKLPDGLILTAICKRDNALDAFISNHYKTIESLIEGSTIGTSSPRRKSQILNYKKNILIKPIRGNIETRLKLLDLGKYDAIILAVAGLKRLGLENRINQIISTNISLPSGGQGAIGIECLINNYKIISLLKKINHKDSEILIKAERSFNKELNSECQLPIGSYATLKNNKICLKGIIGSINGTCLIKDKQIGNKEQANIIGKKLAKKIIKNGGKEIIKSFIKKKHDNFNIKTTSIWKKTSKKII